MNLPTGGWGSLSVAAAKEVVLPTTVEQHFWGKFGQRPYTPEEYRYAADDPIPQNGAYLGVSWWHRQIEIPEDWKGKRIFLHIRGARLRAEVFVNHKLVGYSIMEELPFECDLTQAADPGGFNLIAIRITNPFGRYDWVDGLNAQWGAVRLYRSHGFGGLDRGMTLAPVPRQSFESRMPGCSTPLTRRTIRVRAEVIWDYGARPSDEQRWIELQMAVQDRNDVRSARQPAASQARRLNS